MDNNVYKKTIKKKEIELISALDLLGNNVLQKIKNKNNIITTLNSKIENVVADNNCKKNKNKEFDVLKRELNSILKDIDNIITNITT